MAYNATSKLITSLQHHVSISDAIAVDDSDSLEHMEAVGDKSKRTDKIAC